MEKIGWIRETIMANKDIRLRRLANRKFFKNIRSMNPALIKHSSWLDESVTKYFLSHKLGMLRKRLRSKNLCIKTHCTLTRQELLKAIPKDLCCPVFHKPFVFKERSKWNMSIDRINNLKGYHKDNIVVVSDLVNTIKSSATINEMYMVANFYYELEKNNLDK